MDSRHWEKSVTCFQAHARAFLVRKEVRHAQEDFEAIVKEIDGVLAHLEWRETIISIPHFKDTDGPFLQASGSVNKHLDLEQSVGASSHSPATPASAPLSEGEGGNHCVPPQKTIAETDDPPAEPQACADGPVSGEGGRVCSNGARKDRILESTRESPDVWSIVKQVTNNKGAQSYCLAQEVPLRPQALRLHRNTLTMDLVWLQQAIDSRKKYLSLKDNLSVS